MKQSDKERRKPLLIDKFLQELQILALHDPAEVRKLQATVRNARRFYLDSEGSAHLGEIMMAIPEQIVEQQQFAIPPYQAMWVELDPIALARVTNKTNKYIEHSDEQLAYLFIGNNVHVVVGAEVSDANNPNACALMPINFTLHRPWADHEQQSMAQALGVSRLELVSWCWGAAMKTWIGDYYEEADEPKLAKAKLLRDAHTAQFYKTAAKFFAPRPNLSREIFEGSAGELRNITSLLLVMNQPSAVTYVRDVGFGHSFYKGKSVTYLSHRVVSISMEARERIVRVASITNASPKRAHEVRGHFCHDSAHKQINCDHQWEQQDENHWQCKQCNGKRWWRHEHQRGDASLGFVDKSYQLKQ